MGPKPLWRKTIILKNGKRVVGISESDGFGVINCIFHIAEGGSWTKEAEGVIYSEIMLDAETGKLIPYSVPVYDIERLECERVVMLQEGYAKVLED